MKEIIGFFIFCIILFIYLHIYFHFKTSDDLEIYEMDYTHKDKFEEICDLRQPVIFDFDNEKICNRTSIDYLQSNYHAFDVKTRNINDNDDSTDLYLQLTLEKSIKLFAQDSTSSYYSENNSDFLNETCAIKSLQNNDSFLRPYMVSNCN